MRAWSRTPLSQGQLLNQGFLGQPMGELVAPHGLRQLLDQPHLQGLLQGLQQLVFGKALSCASRRIVKEPEQLVQAKFPADDRGGGQYPVAFLRQPVEALAYNFADTLGNSKTWRSSGFSPAQLPLLSQETDHFGQEIGVALGVGEYVLYQGLIRSNARGLFCQTAGLVQVQAPQQVPLEHLLPGKLGKGIGERMLTGQLHVPIAADHEYAAIGQLLRQEAKQKQRRLVGPMEIVQDQHQRLRASGAF